MGEGRTTKRYIDIEIHKEKKQKFLVELQREGEPYPWGGDLPRGKG